MGVLGVLIGVAEIVIGIIVLFNSGAQPLFIGTGIGYILSGALFIWLCIAASTAFDNEKKINELKAQIKVLKDKEEINDRLFMKLNISQEEIEHLSQTSFSKMQAGHPLVSLAEKLLTTSNITIPIGTSLTFVRIEKTNTDFNNVIVDVVIEGETHRVRYMQCEVISAYLVSKENL